MVIKSIPTQPFLALRASIPTPQEMFELLYLLQQAVPARLDQQILSSLAAVVHTVEFRLEDNDIEIGYLLIKMGNNIMYIRVTNHVVIDATALNV